jgi:hypothetical protein
MCPGSPSVIISGTESEDSRYDFRLLNIQVPWVSESLSIMKLCPLSFSSPNGGGPGSDQMGRLNLHCSPMLTLTSCSTYHPPFRYDPHYRTESCKNLASSQSREPGATKQGPMKEAGHFLSLPRVSSWP